MSILSRISNFLFRKEYSQERFDMSRIQYAKDNPWVLSYDFGHKELIEKSKSFYRVL